MAKMNGTILRALASCAAEERKWFALHYVHVQPRADGVKGTRWAATDGRMLLVVETVARAGEAPCGPGFIGLDAIRRMRASDVVDVEGMRVIVRRDKGRGAPAESALLAEGGANGRFPDVEAAFAAPCAAPDARVLGFGPDLLAMLAGAIGEILGLDSMTVEWAWNGGPGPVRLDARGPSAEVAWSTADDAVGHVTVRALLMPRETGKTREVPEAAPAAVPVGAA